MPETGRIIFGDKSFTVTYTSIFQLYEIYGVDDTSRILLNGLYIGATIILEETDLKQVTLMVTDVTPEGMGKCKAIIKK